MLIDTDKEYDFEEALFESCCNICGELLDWDVNVGEEVGDILLSAVCCAEYIMNIEAVKISILTKDMVR